MLRLKQTKFLTFSNMKYLGLKTKYLQWKQTNQTTLPVVVTVTQVGDNQGIFEERILSGVETVHAGEPLTRGPSYQHFDVAFFRQPLLRFFFVHHLFKYLVAIVAKHFRVRVVQSESLCCRGVFFDLQQIKIIKKK